MKEVRYEVANRIGRITLCRPEKKNALSPGLILELRAAFRQAATDEPVKVVILQAEGDVFSAGADLAALQKMQQATFENNLHDSRQLKELFQLVYSFPKIVIAAVNGHALAGGCGLATVCDFVFAVPEAKFGYTEVKIGFVPAVVAVFLLRKFGEQTTRQLLLSGNLFSALEAKELGLVHTLAEPGALDRQVTEFAQQLINNNSGEAMTTTKKLIVEAQDLPLGDALEYAAGINARARATQDCIKGVEAFLHKQPLVW